MLVAKHRSGGASPPVTEQIFAAQQDSECLQREGSKALFFETFCKNLLQYKEIRAGRA